MNTSSRMDEKMNFIELPYLFICLFTNCYSNYLYTNVCAHALKIYGMFGYVTMCMQWQA